MFMLRDCSTTLSRAWWLGLLALANVASPAMAQNPSFPEDSIAPSIPINRAANFPAPSNFSNTIPSNANQYVVYVPGNNPMVLQQVKAIVPDAFSGRLDNGQSVVQIGRFNNSNLAQRRVEQLKQMGLSADVATVSTKLATTMPVADPFNPISSPTNTLGVPNLPPSNFPNNDLPGVPSAIPPAGQGTIEISRPQQPYQAAPQLPGPTASINPPPEVSRNRYFVIIPSSADAILQKTKNIVPTARLTATERGTYIEVQGYPERRSADTLSSTLRSQGLDSRVIYF